VGLTLARASIRRLIMNSFDEVLAEALRVTQEAKLPPHLESVAFEKAIDALSGTARPIADRDSTRQSFKANGETQDSVLERIARKLDIELSLVEEVFSLDPDKGVQLIVGVGKLETEKSAAARQLATLTVGSRQLGGVEDWTGARTIREVCQHYGKFDSANFAGTLTQMDDIFGFKGKGQGREVKINKPGCEAFKGLIVTLTESSR
jgi:hypothetical protein